MSAPLRFRPADLPGVAAAITRICAEASRLAPCVDIPAGDPQLVMVQTLADRLPHGRLFHVSEPMTRLAVAAAHQFAVFDPETRPSRDGVLAFAVPLPRATPSDLAGGVDTEADYASCAPSVLTWATSDNNDLHVGVWSRLADVEELPGAPPRFFVRDFELVVQLVYAGTTLYPVDDLAAVSPGSVPLTSLVGACWSLMTSPAMTTSRERLPPKRARKGRRAAARNRPVVVIDLADAHHGPAVKPESPSSRTYSHRWWVDPYPRQQRYGPGLSKVKTTWVAGHIKGPDGAPLVERPRVFVWRKAPAAPSGGGGRHLPHTSFT